MAAGALSTYTPIGMGIGGVLAGWLSDRVGRVRVVWWAVLVFSALTGVIAVCRTLRSSRPTRCSTTGQAGDVKVPFEIRSSSEIQRFTIVLTAGGTQRDQCCRAAIGARIARPVRAAVTLPLSTTAWPPTMT